MIVIDNSRLQCDNNLFKDNNEMFANCIFNRIKSNKFKLWTGNVRELFALNFNRNSQKYYLWIMSSILVINLVPVNGEISSRIIKGMSKKCKNVEVSPMTNSLLTSG